MPLTFKDPNLEGQLKANMKLGLMPTPAPSGVLAGLRGAISAVPEAASGMLAKVEAMPMSDLAKKFAGLSEGGQPTTGPLQNPFDLPKSQDAWSALREMATPGRGDGMPPITSSTPTAPPAAPGFSTGPYPTSLADVPSSKALQALKMMGGR